MKASEVLEQLATLNGATQSGADGNGFVDGRLLAGIEFIQARNAGERSLRAAWRRRRGNGATPLVLFVDDEDAEDRVLVLGPNSADEPMRSVDAQALLNLITQISSLGGLRAVRTFASELGTLDSTGTAGLVVRGIGTEHLYRHRLRAGGDWASMAESAAGFEGDDWMDLLRHLGYELKRRTDRGYLATAEGRPAMVIHPTRDPDDFSRLDENGALREGALLADCALENVDCGLLASGPRVRVFLTNDDAGALTRYVQMDLDGLDDSDLPLRGMLGPDFVLNGGFDRILQDARDYGTRLRERLDRSLRQEVLPVLGRELGRLAAADGQDLGDDSVREKLEGASLTFVFRTLFLLYAESAGYLPMTHETYRSRSLTRLCERAESEEDEPGQEATTYWDDFTSIIHAMRSGKSSWGVPAYNGELFAADGLVGAGLLEKYAISDGALAPALAALGRDSDEGSGTGLDYSGLEIGHLGHIYEGLLSLKLAVAERDLTYVPRDDRYRPTPEGEDPEIQQGDLTWLTHEGGRKGGGVYYTPARLVRHLVRGSVRPSFAEHLVRVRELAASDPDAAASELFEFHVVDPACGSAHFLVQVADELADQVALLLGEIPMPSVRKQLEALRSTAGKTYDLEIEDAALLKRLVLKQCVFGVDLSKMGTEIAKLSLWLAGFVPGLSLAYLDRNIVCGNSLVGVIDPEEVAVSDRADGNLNIFGGTLSEALRAASKTADELQQIPDRTPDEIDQSRDKNREYEREVAGANRLMDIWTAAYLGFPEARNRALEHGSAILEGDHSLDDEAFVEAARGQEAHHWPTAFAETFGRKNPGFDVVVGNPPWEEVTVEELAFYARYRPGLRGLAATPRAEALDQLKGERPELEAEFLAEKERMSNMRDYLAAQAPDAISAGDPDLYKYFGYRYQRLLRDGGRLGVVLPRSAFLAKGMIGFRRWLEEESPVTRVDFALNSRNWIFEIHPQYTVALVVAQRSAASDEIEVAGVAASAREFDLQVTGPGVDLDTASLGPGLEIPLAPGRDAYDLVARMTGTPFALGGGAWRCFPAGELHETNDRRFWVDAKVGRPLWKGSSFDQYDPAGRDARPCPVTDQLMAKVRKDRGSPGAGSLGACDVPVEARREAVARTVNRERVAFRDVSRATDSRTVRACLIPKETFLTNKAPYLNFLEDDPIHEAACLAVMNSVAFDWQARRYIEINLNFFILELLKVPLFSGDQIPELGERAARLSAVDERFAHFAKACGVEYGPVGTDESLRLRSEIDALVAQAWNLSADDLKLIFEDFPATEAGVSPEYRQAILEAFEAIS